MFKAPKYSRLLDPKEIPEGYLRKLFDPCRVTISYRRLRAAVWKANEAMIRRRADRGLAISWSLLGEIRVELHTVFNELTRRMAKPKRSRPGATQKGRRKQA